MHEDLPENRRPQPYRTNPETQSEFILTEPLCERAEVLAKHIESHLAATETGQIGGRFRQIAQRIGETVLAQGYGMRWFGLVYIPSSKNNVK